MKRMIVVLSIATALSSACATMGFTSSRDTLVKTAAFDHDCPPEKIEVVAEQEDGLGAASFKLNVCGVPRIYKRYGTLYQDASKPMPGTNG
jgi:hypothetical protein